MCLCVSLHTTHSNLASEWVWCWVRHSNFIENTFTYCCIEVIFKRKKQLRIEIFFFQKYTPSPKPSQYGEGSLESASPGRVGGRQRLFLGCDITSWWASPLDCIPQPTFQELLAGQQLFSARRNALSRWMVGLSGDLLEKVLVYFKSNPGWRTSALCPGLPGSPPLPSCLSSFAFPHRQPSSPSIFHRSCCGEEGRGQMHTPLSRKEELLQPQVTGSPLGCEVVGN